MFGERFQHRHAHRHAHLDLFGDQALRSVGDFRIDLRGLSRAGDYVVLVALTVDDNRTDLPVKAIPWTR